MGRIIINYLTNLMPQMESYFTEHPLEFIGFLALIALLSLAILAFYILMAWLLLKVNKKVFREIEARRGKKIHLKFAENLIKFGIITVFVIIPLAGDKITQSILGSAAVITAVVGFAAQDVIRDILSGLLISIYKPFDIGDRIELENGTAGIVETITMRHVVLILVDTVRLIIPNSKINTLAIKNLSYGYVPRSAEFSFPIHYNSKIPLAKKAIYDAIKESRYSIPGKKSKTGEMIYGPVYFISIDDSALSMKVTVYYDHDTPTEVLKDDINTRVFAALGKAGIEIPYPHANVILND